MRARGTVVTAEALDVSDESALRGLLERIRAEGPPLRGIVHSAGVLDDAGLMQQDAARFARVFAPKVQGGWLLDALTRSDPLDWFVLFSSVASVLGSPGQSNHSAANAFLDLLARERKSEGRPGLSINWGAWTDVGAAADRKVTGRLATQGIGALTPAQGIQALERLLGEGRAQVAVAPVEWQKYVQHLNRATVPPFLSEVAGAVRHATAKAAGAPAAAGHADGIRKALAAAPPARKRPLMAGFVRERALRALGVDPARAVDPRTPLGELGLDSLLAIELRNTLGTALGRSLPSTLLFDYPTIDTLTDFLLGEEGASADAPANGSSAAKTPPVSLVGSIEELSDEEVERQLAARSRRK
jgi:acyl carrier protein